MRLMRCLVMVLVLAGFLAGCSGGDAGPDSAGARKSSSANTVIDGLTGRTAVKAGQKAREDITRISEERNRDLEAVLPQ